MQPTSVSSGFVPEISFEDIVLKGVVGKGTFGVVHKGFWKDRDVAVKLITTEQEKQAFFTEINALSKVEHPNIVKLYGASTKVPVCLVMEYAEGGSLYDMLHLTRAEYTFSHAMSWCLQCAKGVAYLHGIKPRPLVHRDLKPPNLLLINGGTGVKICDFGTACDIHTHMTNNKGSAAWMAPEVFEGQVYDEKCDVHSWGIILWEVLARRRPFDELGGPVYRIMWAVHDGTRPPLLRNCPNSLETLMTDCWKKLPHERPSMADVELKMEELSQFCSNEADTPIVFPPKENVSLLSQESLEATVSPLDTQRPAPQQVVTEPTVFSSDSNADLYHLLFHSKRIVPFSVPPNLSGSSIYTSNFLHTNPFLPPVSPPTHRRKSNDSSGVETSNFRGHRRSGSYGATTSIEIVGKQDLLELPQERGLSKSRSFGDNSLLEGEAPGNEPEPSPDNNHQGLDNVQVYNYLATQFDDAHLVLEPRLQPVEPEPKNQESLNIYDTHKRLAQSYVRNKIEIDLYMERKCELEQRLNSDQNQNHFYDDYNQLKIKQEKEDLIKLRNDLKEQVIRVKRKQRQKEAKDDGDWVLVEKSNLN